MTKKWFKKYPKKHVKNVKIVVFDPFLAFFDIFVFGDLLYAAFCALVHTK